MLGTAGQRLPPWPDSIVGLNRLAARLPLIGLSNASRTALLRLNAHAGLRWHQQDGARPSMRITEAGMDAIGTAPTDAAAVHEAADDVGQTAPGTVPANVTEETRHRSDRLPRRGSGT